MRKNATSPFIKAVFAAIVIVFVFWGVGSIRNARGGRVAKVNGEALLAKDFSRYKQNLLELFRQRAGGSLTEEQLQQLDIPQKALDQLVLQELFIQEARAMGLSVTTDELVDYIGSQRWFQDGSGRFSKEGYQSALADRRMTPGEYESSQIKQLMYQKMRALVLGSATVTDAEARAWYNWNNRQISVDYLAVEPSRYSGVTATEEEIKALYSKNPERWRAKEAVKAVYAQLSGSDFRSRVEVKKEEIAEYFDNNADEFYQEETIRARHILIKTPPDDTEKDIEEARKKIAALETKVKAGEDFAKLAMENSEDGSAAQGGDLGFFSRDKMVPEFSEAAFSLKPGEVSAPVRTQFGWHLIKCEEVKPARNKELAEVKEEIQAKLEKTKADNDAYAKALAVYDKALNLRDLAQAAKESGVEVKATGFFTRESPPTDIMGGDSFAKQAFDLQLKDVAEVMELPGGFVVLQVVEKRPSRIPALEEVKADVAREAALEKQKEKAGEEAKAILAEVKAGEGLADAAKKRGLTVKSSGFFKRTDSIPELGYDPGLFDGLFLLSVKHPLPAAPIEAGKGYYVARLVEEKAPDQAGFDTEKETIVQNLRNAKEAGLYESWSESVRSRAKIQIDQDSLNSAR
jgi:peptidyl-prolyl cis-trans isomerase D